MFLHLVKDHLYDICQLRGFQNKMYLTFYVIYVTPAPNWSLLALGRCQVVHSAAVDCIIESNQDFFFHISEDAERRMVVLCVIQPNTLSHVQYSA